MAASVYGGSTGTVRRRRAGFCARWKKLRLNVPVRSSRVCARSCGLSAPASGPPNDQGAQDYEEITGESYADDK